MSYCTEGYVKGVGVSKKENPSKADKLCIETVAPYKLQLHDKDFALFVEEKDINSNEEKDINSNEEKDINSNEEIGAKIKSVAALESIECKEFDAQFLFLLKQTHSKVRFVFNDELNVLERIVAI